MIGNERKHKNKNHQKEADQAPSSSMGFIGRKKQTSKHKRVRVRDDSSDEG